jgi:hypothetical protein
MQSLLWPEALCLFTSDFGVAARCRAERLWHRRETRRQTENTNVMPIALEGLFLLDKNPNMLLYQQLCIDHEPCLSLNFMTLSPILIIM